MNKTQLTSDKQLTNIVKEKSIVHWEDLLAFVRAIPYGRSSSRTDFSLVITENCGTCSSKHAFLRAVADENDIKDVQLILCMYKMNAQNTPGIGTEMAASGLDFIPEAHCYLKIGVNKYDLTNPTSDLTRIEKDILKEIEIEPIQVGTFKVDYHKKFLKEWIKNDNLDFSFEEVWQIREQCINNLSGN